MAFQAKDGSKHTNRDSMKHADAKHAASQPAPVEHESEPVEGQGEPQQQEIQSPEELQDAFDQHMQEHMSGQPHDPHNTKRLANHFSKKAQESTGGGVEDQGSGGY